METKPVGASACCRPAPNDYTSTYALTPLRPCYHSSLPNGSSATTSLPPSTANHPAMTKFAPITPQELDTVLRRLGALALADGIELRLRVTGGALMMLEFNSRASATRDVDVLAAAPAGKLASYAATIAQEQGWPATWLNDSAKKFEQDAPLADTEDPEVRRYPGLVITRPSLRRMLAWKLARYMDDTDRQDALTLLRRILAETPYDRDDLWLQLEGHLAPSERPEACYNLEDAWDELDTET